MHNPLAGRFRHLLPVVVDVETAGLNPATDALLEIAIVLLNTDHRGKLYLGETHSYHVEPFSGGQIDPESLAITGIDPTCPLRAAIPEQQALHRIFRHLEQALAAHRCYKAVLVGHNSWFDLHFLNQATKRSGLTQLNPFHAFTSFDTATLAGVLLGETVLIRSARRARINFDLAQAHSAAYDAQRTAELFCYLVNGTQGWRTKHAETHSGHTRE